MFTRHFVSVVRIFDIIMFNGNEKFKDPQIKIYKLSAEVKEASGEPFLLELFKLTAHMLKQDGFGGLDGEPDISKLRLLRAAHMNNVWHQMPIWTSLIGRSRMRFRRPF